MSPDPIEALLKNGTYATREGAALGMIRNIIEDSALSLSRCLVLIAEVLDQVNVIGAGIRLCGAPIAPYLGARMEDMRCNTPVVPNQTRCAEHRTPPTLG